MTLQLIAIWFILGTVVGIEVGALCDKIEAWLKTRKSKKTDV